MKNTRVAFSWAAPAVLITLLLVACGGGEDAGLSRAEVGEIVREELADAPVPSEPEPELTAADVEEAIRAAMADIPQQEPGVTRNEVEGIVKAAIDAISTPQPGLTSADVEEAFRAAIAEMPQPESGLSKEEVERIVESAIAAIPTPQPGLTSAQVEDAIRTALADMPQPGPGLTPAEAELIARGVVASIPPKSAPAEYTKFFVEKAISRYETQGLDATLAYYNHPESIDGQWYVFIIDQNDLVIGHPESQRLGLDVNGWVGTDANGYNFGPDMLSATEDGKWVSYVYRNPESGGIGDDHTGTLQLKNAWVVRHDGLLFASGWYIIADEFTKFLVATAARVFREVGLEGTIAYFASPEIVFGGLAAVIAYYNSAENVEGNWFAFIADESGTIIDHYRKEMVGKSLEDVLGTDTFEATAEGNWVTTESLRVWVVGQDGMTFGSGWHHDELGN